MLLLCSAPLLYPQASEQKCRLEGQVLNSLTGQPVRKVNLVMLPFRGGAGRNTGSVTDAEGRFEIAGIEPGSYRLIARRDGFVIHEYGAKGPGKPPETLTLGPGDEKRGLVIRLTPFGAIAGRILDQDGDPIQMLQVNAMVYGYTSSGRRLMLKSSTTTNDLGEYRMFGLDPGRYYVMVRPNAVRGLGGDRADDEGSYIASYYPGTADANGAALLDLTGGQQLRGIDMTLRKTRAARIRGRVIKAAGMSSVTIGLISVTAGGGSSSDSVGLHDPDGKFEFHGIPPGSEILFATGNVGDKQYMARLPIEVGSTDIEGLELRPLPPAELRGRVRIEGRPDFNVAQLQLVLDTAMGERTFASPVGADGTFLLTGMVPDIYHFSVINSQDLYLKAIRWGDGDITDHGLDLTGMPASASLEVILSANAGQIDGSVENEKSEPASSVMVTLLPVGPRRMKPFFKVAVTNARGQFLIRGVAPGRYKVFAWDEVNPDAVLYDPEFMQPFDSMGKNIEISEQGKETVQLKLIRNTPGN